MPSSHDGGGLHFLIKDPSYKISSEESETEFVSTHTPFFEIREVTCFDFTLPITSAAPKNHELLLLIANLCVRTQTFRKHFLNISTPPRLFSFMARDHPSIILHELSSRRGM